MALLKCPECGREISEYAASCIGCGCPMPRIKEIMSANMRKSATTSTKRDTDSPVKNSKDEELYSCLLSAAYCNDAQAQCELGSWFFAGEKVEQDLFRAYIMFKRAADLGDAEGQYFLGFFYEHGYGCEKDIKLAKKFYGKALEQGHGEALYRYLLINDWMKAENCVHASSDWLEKRAKDGDADAQVALGSFFGGTKDDEGDWAKALYWYQNAAEQGHKDGQYYLAQLYDQGLGVRKNTKKANYWYQKAAEQGHVTAQHNLATNYFCGYGVGKDEEKNQDMAIYWSQKAAHQGDLSACFMAARLLIVKKEFDQAEVLLKRVLQNEGGDIATELLNRLYAARAAETKRDTVGQTVQNANDKSKGAKTTTEEPVYRGAPCEVWDDDYMYEVREQMREQEEYYRDWAEYTRDD